MITEALQKAFKWPIGYLLNEGYIVKCAGLLDSEGNLQRHTICTLDDHLPGAQAHAVGNSEFTDSLWVIDPQQTSIDWSAPKCCICQQELAP